MDHLSEQGSSSSRMKSCINRICAGQSRVSTRHLDDLQRLSLVSNMYKTNYMSVISNPPNLTYVMQCYILQDSTTSKYPAMWVQFFNTSLTTTGLRSSWRSRGKPEHPQKSRVQGRRLSARVTKRRRDAKVCKQQYSTFSYFKVVNVVDENIRIQRYVGLFDNIVKQFFIQCR